MHVIHDTSTHIKAVQLYEHFFLLETPFRKETEPAAPSMPFAFRPPVRWLPESAAPESARLLPASAATAILAGGRAGGRTRMRVPRPTGRPR